MRLNQGQQVAFEETIEFLNDKTRKHHRISGDPGTGKTFFISQIVKNLLQYKGTDCTIRDVAVTATTNKAASVISTAMPDYIIKTVYSYMALKVTHNYSRGTSKCTPTNRFVVHSNLFLIIDESSMVDKNLREYIEKGTDKSCKILWVGDKNQIPPVGEAESAVYSQKMTESVLSVPVRNSGSSELIDLCAQAKEIVRTGIFTPIKHIPGVVEFVTGPQLKGLIERNYIQEDENRRILAYTNQQVINYNSVIRDMRGYTRPYEVGEIVTNNTSSESADARRIYTDQTLVIKDVVGPIDDQKIYPEETIEVYHLTLECVITGAQYQTSVFANPEHQKIVLKELARKKDWFSYFSVKEKFPDLRPIAASTVHKSQGGTFNSVIVDLGDIGKCTQVDTAARLLYVALSRPKKHLYIKGELPARFFK